MKLLSDPQLKKIVRLAIKEDLGELGDITSNTVLTKRDRATFHFVSRAKGILCGMIFRQGCRGYSTDERSVSAY